MQVPDFSKYGYQINQELGHNFGGGRVTYLATEINTNRRVVLKQFQFAKTGATWSDYNAYQREIEVLRSINHPQIPHYLDSFQTATGFCMIQEYKNAPSLANPKQWTPYQVKQIAIAVLGILRDLQSHIPPIIHRDLKPENILVDDSLNVSLVDFGFARLGGGEVAVSSVVKGTLGFMPPEQMFNRQLTPASDLYSLGATLICLLTNTNSTEVGSLIDDTGRIDFKSKVSHLSDEFINWLEKMVNPNYQHRYPNAEAALDALIPLNVLRPNPSVPMQKMLWLKLGLVTASVAIFVPVVLNIPLLKRYLNREQINTLSPANNIISVKVTPNANAGIEEISRKLKRVYFEVDLSSLATSESYLNTTCTLFNEKGTLVALGKSVLTTNNQKSRAWCWYDFSADSQPGEWRFEFSIDGNKFAEKIINVL